MEVIKEEEYLEDVLDCLSWMLQEDVFRSAFLESVCAQVRNKGFITDKQVEVINEMLYHEGYEDITLKDK